MRSAGFSLLDISMEIRDGEVVGLLGESGSGKSTLANILTRLSSFDSGRVLFRGEDISEFTASQAFAFKSQVQIVFQDPYGSLNPRASIRSSVGEGLKLHRSELGRQEIEARVDDLLGKVGMAGENLSKYPHEFSGGQRQRIAIARALAVDPMLLVCDEPLSSLDVSIQAQIIELFVGLIAELNLAMLFISHDINVVRLLCNRVYVMHQGRIIEAGKTDQILSNPTSDHTIKLLQSVY